MTQGINESSEPQQMELFALPSSPVLLPADPDLRWSPSARDYARWARLKPPERVPAEPDPPVSRTSGFKLDTVDGVARAFDAYPWPQESAAQSRAYPDTTRRLRGQPFRFEYDLESGSCIVWLADVWVTTLETPQALWQFLKDEKMKRGSRLIRIVSRIRASKETERSLIRAFVGKFGVKVIPGRMPKPLGRAPSEPKAATRITLADLGL